MSRIKGEFVADIARVWHRFEPKGQDMDALAEMLAPMDDAGEVVAEDVAFDMEPADFFNGLENASTKVDPRRDS